MASTNMQNPNVYVPHQFQRDRVIQQGDVIISEISGIETIAVGSKIS